MLEMDFDITEIELVEAPSAAYDFVMGVAAGAAVYGLLIACGC
jgi:hypothetical protein